MNKLFRFAYILGEYRSVLLTTMHDHYKFTKGYKGRKIKSLFSIRRKKLRQSIKHHKDLLNFK